MRAGRRGAGREGGGSRTLIEQIQANWTRVRGRVRAAAARAGRRADDVRLVAVTKEASEAAARALLSLGQRHLGENRVQPALRKIEALGPGPVWHLIGHLQANKVRKVVGRFAWIHSVDSIDLLERIDRIVNETGAPPPVLCLQVNVTGEASKHGLRPDAVEPALRRASDLTGVRVAGLMTLPRLDPDPETARPVFRALRALEEEANRGSWYRSPLTELSMGMSGDYEVAVEEGATVVRVGSALFS